MEKLDADGLETLLKLNPHLDREAIKARQDKIAKEGPRARISGDSASPYRGKRAAIEDRVKWQSAQGKRRTRYQNM